MTPAVQTWPTSPSVPVPIDALSPDQLAIAEELLITEDDTPVDNIYSELQMKLFTDLLSSSWKPGRKFVAFSDVGVYMTVATPAIAPDFFIGMDVGAADESDTTASKSYLVWRIGKVPDIVIEIVSNTIGGELTTKQAIYGTRMNVRYYVVWDPYGYIAEEPLTALEWRNGSYHPMPKAWFPGIGLGLAPRRGVYLEHERTWLRWVDAEGVFLPTGKEQTELKEAERRRADAERQRADAEAERAKAERQIGRAHV